MYLAADEHEAGITASAADFLADAMPIGRLHGKASPDMNATLRGQIGEMGWFGLALAEDLGGAGLSSVEHVLFFREVGRHCGPVDLLAQSLAVLTAVDQPDLMAAILAGEQGVAIAVPQDASLRLFGDPGATLALIADLAGAQLLNVANASSQAKLSLDPTTSMRVIAADSARPVASMPGDRIWRFGQLGAAAMLVGLSEAALDLIVEYAKVRETFGRKIGSYQAVRHPCADMAVRLEAARAQLWYASAALKEEHADAPAHIEAAKHLANIAAVANADTNIQLHGGIGITDEHDSHLLLKHSLLLARLFGSKRALLGNLLHARLEA